MGSRTAVIVHEYGKEVADRSHVLPSRKAFNEYVDREVRKHATWRVYQRQTSMMSNRPFGPRFRVDFVLIRRVGDGDLVATFTAELLAKHQTDSCKFCEAYFTEKQP